MKTKQTTAAIVGGLLFAALIPPAGAQSAGQCERGIAQAQRYIEQFEAEAQATAGIRGDACASLKLGIVAEWSNQQCADDPALDAAKRQQSRQQKPEIHRSNRQLEKLAMAVEAGGQRCELNELGWTELVEKYAAKKQDGPDWENLGKTPGGEAKQDSPDWNSLGKPAGGGAKQDPLDWNSLGESVAKTNQGAADWENLGQDNIRYANRGAPDWSIGQNPDGLRRDLARWNEAEKRRKAEERARRIAEELKAQRKKLARQAEQIAKANRKAQREAKEARQKAERERQEAIWEAEDRAEAERAARWRQRMAQDFADALGMYGKVKRGDTDALFEYNQRQFEKHAANLTGGTYSAGNFVAKISGKKCQQGIEEAMSQARRYEAEASRANNLVDEACASLKLGIVAEWSNQQCANDSTLNSSRRQQSRQQMNEIRRSNRQLEKLAMSVETDNKRCELGGVGWTGLVDKYR